MTTTVLIPFAGTDHHRVAALEWVQARYAELEWPVIVGTGNEHQWCKAEAVQRALAQTDAELLIVADSDVWADDIAAAVAGVERRGGWTIPHMRVYRLNEQSTREVLDGAAPTSAKRGLSRPSYVGVVGGGIIVLERELYERVPLDPRFVGWGGEDIAWGYALETIDRHHVERLSGALWHLWHEPQERESMYVGNAENNELRKRYRKALNQPGVMRALVDEARELLAEVACRSTIC